MISYAQNAEDAVLARLFATPGFYIDIGAGHPTLDSVTKHFYDHGWRGLNVEPMRRMFDLLQSERPRDINVHAAASDRAGTVTLYEAPEGNLGASTLDAENARAQSSDREAFVPVVVEAVTVARLVAEHRIDRVDFVKIDAEGHEPQIVRSTDWTTLAPRVVVVEAVEPNSNEPSHMDWEEVLLDAGYRCTLFDGINRFYARAGDTEAIRALSVPANVLDDIEPWRWVSQIEGAKEHIARLEDARAEAERYARELAEERAKKQEDRGRDPLARRAFRRVLGR